MFWWVCKLTSMKALFFFNEFQLLSLLKLIFLFNVKLIEIRVDLLDLFLGLLKIDIIE